MWIDFPQSLMQVQGSRRYVTLFEYMIATALMNNQENLALRACSLRAIPPLPPEGVQLEGLT